MRKQRNGAIGALLQWRCPRGNEPQPSRSRFSALFFVLLTVTGLLFALTHVLDSLWPLGNPQGFGHRLSLSLFDQDLAQARNSLDGLAEVMAAILGLALTVSSIIVQLAATRFTPHVTSLFLTARTNIAVLAYFVIANVFVLWMNFSISEHYLPQWGLLFSLLLLTTSLLLLFPYFAYLLHFLEPDSIIHRITRDGLWSPLSLPRVTIRTHSIPSTSFWSGDRTSCKHGSQCRATA